MAYTIVHSAEADAVLLDSIYRQYLGRTPDQGGLEFFTNYLENGGTMEGVVTNILSSEEYKVDVMP